MSDPVEAKPPRKGGILSKLLVPLAFLGGAAAGGAGGAIGVMHFAPPPAAAPAPPPPAPVEYIEFDNAFTSNLVDTGRYLQLRLSVSTTGGAAATAAIGRHKPALVSAILAVLGECGEAQVADRQAKERLRERIRDVFNETLKSRGEPARIEDVFFTSLVVQ